jgi:hypothetical protein
MLIKFYSGNLNGRDYLGYKGTDERYNIEMYLKEIGC